MNIAIVMRSLTCGGAETVAIQLGRYLARADNHVDLVTTSERGEWFEQVPQNGIRIKHVAGRFETHPWRHAYRVGRFIKSQNYDVVLYSNSERFGQAALHMLPKNVIAMPWIHSDTPDAYHNAAVNRSVWNVAIAVGPRVAAGAEQVFGDRPVECILNGLETPQSAEKPIKSTSAVFRLVYVGRIQAHPKGVLLLPEIVAACVRRKLNVTLTIVGDGPDLSILKDLVLQQGIGDRVDFRGRCTKAQTVERLSQSDALLLPSCSEGLPCALIEAQMCGCVPIATRLDDSTDVVVRQGITGYLVEQADVDGFTNAIQSLAEEPARLSEMSNAARRHALDNFSVDRMGQQVIALIKNARDGNYALSHRRRKWMPVNLAAFTWREHIPRSVHALGLGSWSRRSLRLMRECALRARMFGVPHCGRMVFEQTMRPWFLKRWGRPMMMRHLRRHWHTLERTARREKGIRYTPVDTADTADSAYCVTATALGLSAEPCAAIRGAADEGGVVKLGAFDQDGYLISDIGSIDGFRHIEPTAAIARKRFDVDLVLYKGTVAVRKSFRGDRVAFLRELNALNVLNRAGCNVPHLLEADPAGVTITMTYIRGRVLRDALADSGARIEDRDYAGGAANCDESDGKARLRRIEEGKSVLPSVVNKDFIDALFRELQRVHEAGVIYNDIKYGNVIIEHKTGRPYLLDFDHADCLFKMNPHLLRKLRDRDIDAFNLHFGTTRVTEEALKKTANEDNYAPAWITSGIATGSIWNADVGFGRWHFILKHHLGDLKGLRILDLGANNAVPAMEMLRSGAREVAGIESNSRFMTQGCYVREAVEWADNRHYNYRPILADMATLPELGLGEFDLVTALCSLYYLEEEDIHALVRYLHRITPTVVLQANHRQNIQRADPRTYHKASAAFAENALRQGGFSSVRIVSRRGYERPLIIGKR